METSVNKRRRILLHFFLGIGLPSLLLGYLAFRGIQNDQALLEKERRNEHRVFAHQITRAIDEHILKIEQTFLDSVANHQSPHDSAPLRILDNLKSQHPVVEEVFFLAGSGHLLLPSAKFLFTPDGSAHHPPQGRLSSVLEEVQLSQQYEFRQHEYQKALASYRHGFADVSANDAKAALLNAMARVQRKSNALSDAIESYTKLARDFDHSRAASGIPWGLAARIELGILSLAYGDSSSAIETLMGLYEDLIHGKWALEESQYEFFAQRIETSMDGLAAPLQSYQSTFQSLNIEEKKQRSRTERLLAFQEHASSLLRSKGSQDNGNPHFLRKRHALEIEGGTYLVSLLGEQKRREAAVGGFWGLLLNAEYLKDDLLKLATQRHVASEGVHWIVKGEDGEAIFQSDLSPKGSLTIKTDFAGGFPPWTLEFYQQDPRLFESLLTSRQGIYFFMFILIAGILIFGLTWTMRTISHELELGQMKSDFVSTVSHELKSPLTAIRQLAEMTVG